MKLIQRKIAAHIEEFTYKMDERSLWFSTDDR